MDHQRRREQEALRKSRDLVERLDAEEASRRRWLPTLLMSLGLIAAVIGGAAILRKMQTPPELTAEQSACVAKAFQAAEVKLRAEIDRWRKDPKLTPADVTARSSDYQKSARADALKSCTQ